jgi:hypothetical protein
MAGGGLETDPQRVGDFFGALAFGYALQHRPFAIRQPVPGIHWFHPRPLLSVNIQRIGADFGDV